jgi:hypothetical protein
MTDGERRFSLDPIKADPSLKNLIYSADGDETVGEWNGEDIHDLVRELDRIEERIDANYNSLPHSPTVSSPSAEYIRFFKEGSALMGSNENRRSPSVITGFLYDKISGLYSLIYT